MQVFARINAKCFEDNTLTILKIRTLELPSDASARPYFPVTWGYALMAIMQKFEGS